MAKLQFGPLVSVGSADSNFARVVWIFFHLPYVSENPSKLASFWGTTKSLAQSPLIVGGSQGSWKNMAEESLEHGLVESRGSETSRGSRATLSVDWPTQSLKPLKGWKWKSHWGLWWTMKFSQKTMTMSQNSLKRIQKGTLGIHRYVGWRAWKCQEDISE